MSVPATRDDFKAYCLRRIGDGVIQINVSDDQVDDRIDDALRYFHDYHFDGSEKRYYKYQITDQDKANQYITLPDEIIGVSHVFPFGMSLSSNNLFNIRYQIALNDLYDLTAASMTPYYMAMQNIQFLEQMIVGNDPINFNKHNNILYIHTDWQMAVTGEYMIIECYYMIDPEVYPKVWSDRWLQMYATQMIKRQWGENLIKYSGINLPGGNKFNGEKIYNDADNEIKLLEKEMVESWSIPLEGMLG